MSGSWLSLHLSVLLHAEIIADMVTPAIPKVLGNPGRMQEVLHYVACVPSLTSRGTCLQNKLVDLPANPQQLTQHH